MSKRPAKRAGDFFPGFEPAPKPVPTPAQHRRTSRFHKGRDGWGRDSYVVPGCALVGSSDCGDSADSPAPLADIKPEFRRFVKEVLKPLGIKRVNVRHTRSGNLFMVKRWLCVPAKDWARCLQPAKDWLEANNDSTRLIHDADLPAAVTP